MGFRVPNRFTPLKKIRPIYVSGVRRRIIAETLNVFALSSRRRFSRNYGGDYFEIDRVYYRTINRFEITR